MMPTYSYSKLSNKISQWIKYPGMKRYSKNIYTVINNIVPILEYIPNVNLIIYARTKLKMSCLNNKKSGLTLS